MRRQISLSRMLWAADTLLTTPIHGIDADVSILGGGVMPPPFILKNMIEFVL